MLAVNVDPRPLPEPGAILLPLPADGGPGTCVLEALAVGGCCTPGTPRLPPGKGGGGGPAEGGLGTCGGGGGFGALCQAGGGGGGWRCELDANLTERTQEAGDRNQSRVSLCSVVGEARG
ncbi:uncharacterized protein A4U43_C04F33770 [Asparagus officinalis]|uniref:Uncharacterized protein n=1 Tax=Asparagus officinalis TaxID=4686 RepID=A0A5P1F5I7_ASPOF|nr:uncharacterized protein A4U43_C04F33770 [Asparagus officinalis]